ncbi:hypothetical protein [Streptomyces sp. A30]|uniref:hypothetical protein n=1 Tax=Streptomyces sp. A30 TaxID=2789273 RepID=UPI003980D6DE
MIEAVGVDAQRPAHGPAPEAPREQAEQFDHERQEAAPERNPDGETRVPGDAPTLAARGAMQLAAQAGTVGTVGVCPPQVQHYPFREAFRAALTPHR